MQIVSSDGDRVNELFANCSRDVTPAAAQHTCRVRYAPLSLDPEVSKNCASVLSNSERQRADRFVRDVDRINFLQRRAFRRFCAVKLTGLSRPLQQIIFSETQSGQPFLAEYPGFRFSFSSCRSGFLCAWSTTHGVGIDLEDQSRKLEADQLARFCFSPGEAHTVIASPGHDRRAIFFQLWTLKEAALKSIGEGLPFGLDTFEFESGPNPRVLRAPPDHGGVGRFRAHRLEGFDGYGSLVVHRPV